MAVVGSGLVGMLIYAGLFYSNARRTVPASSEIDGSIFQSREEAETAANEWISRGGVYVVETLTTVRRTVPVTAIEKKKLKSQIDQSMRRKIEADYNRCLQKAETNLAKELCSFGPHEATVGDAVKIPQKKTIQDRKVNKVEYQRRECIDDQELRSFECIELDVARDEIVSRSEEGKETPVKVFQQFRY
ncbi:hypothetical protein [Synechococcus sp. CC9311]|uniref:hypothetical protein n=1 Tax=Synechococcus sp. (strain CC9311) TaxID=64471 RepID=UPI001ED92FFF|nr:hypothetical protein [Synechococcus sp. CC9311]